MQDTSSIELIRDCEAVIIPAGNKVTLEAGTPVDIAQTLGGTFTVRVGGSLYRIAASDADALGLEAVSKAGGDAGTMAPVSVEHLEKQVWDSLKTCYDPEIPVNIVDLGLVYDMHIEPVSGGNKVSVKMTLTAQGCGMGPVIAGDAQQKVLMLSGVDEAEVEIVWDPPWHQSMITAEGRRILGLE